MGLNSFFRGSLASTEPRDPTGTRSTGRGENPNSRARRTDSDRSYGRRGGQRLPQTPSTSYGRDIRSHNGSQGLPSTARATERATNEVGRSVLCKGCGERFSPSRSWKMRREMGGETPDFCLRCERVRRALPPEVRSPTAHCRPREIPGRRESSLTPARRCSGESNRSGSSYDPSSGSNPGGDSRDHDPAGGRSSSGRRR